MQVTVSGSSPHFSDVWFKGAPLECGEDPQWVEVVAPRGDFAVLDDDDGDVSVAVRLPGGDDPSIGGIFENHRRRRRRVVYTQVVAAVQEQRGAVPSVEFDEVVAADDVARVVRNRDDEVEDHVLGQQVEEVVTVNESRKALLDDPKERIESAEVAHVLNHSPLLRMVDSRHSWSVLSLVVTSRCSPRV